MASDQAIVAIKNLVKRFGATTAVDGIDLQVSRGVTYGFLGPNGAGKTTTIRILLGFVRPSSGVARVNGHDCWADGVRARKDLGYLVPADALYQDMTGLALLDYMAALSERPVHLRNRLLDALELSQGTLGRRLGTYSKGMKQKLALTACMQTAPSLLILDEPTDGLDPLIQRSFEEVLAEARLQGATIFMSSHDLAEVERTCSQVAIIRQGRIIAEESIDALRALHRRLAEVTFHGSPPLGIEGMPGVEVVSRQGSRLTVSLTGDVNPFIGLLSRHGSIEDLVVTRPSLEDIFLGYYDASLNGLERPMDRNNLAPDPRRSGIAPE